jgi:hypothetical protein
MSLDLRRMILVGDEDEREKRRGRVMSGSTENRAQGASEKPARRDAAVSLADAVKMLPLVQRIMADLVASQLSLSQLTPEQERLHRQRRVLGWSERSRMYALREQIALAEQTLQEAVVELAALGAVVIDPEFGRVGFPTVVNGRRAYFSWQTGEEGIHFWHFPEEERRRPVPVTWLKSANLRTSEEA